MATVNEKMTAIADNIREKTGGTEALTLDQMASGVNEVYESGKKIEHNAFWDNYLKDSNENGASVRQVSRFAGSAWNDNTFYPNQDIYVKYGYQMFYYNQVSNIKERLEECGSKLIFDNSNSVGSMFESCLTTELPTIELNKVSNKDATQRLCHGCTSLVTIEKIIAVEGNLWGNSFTRCSKLENIVFEGVIGNTISFSDSPLTVESLKSIITHLKDYTATTSEHTYTVTFKASAFEVLEAEGATAEYNGEACTWAELIDNLKWNLVKA